MCASSNAADVMWAKLNPYKSLIHHMLDSGACAEALMRTSFRSSAHQIAETLSVDEKCAVGIVAYIVALHDIGKSHPAFQRKSHNVDDAVYERIHAVLAFDGTYESPGAPFRHERYSADVIRRIWEALGMDDDAIDMVGAVIMRHHQGKRGGARAIVSTIARPYVCAQNELEQRVRNVMLADGTLNALNNCADWSRFCALTEGIIIASDWIASGAWFEEPGTDIPDSADHEYFDMAYATALSAIDDIGIAETALPEIHAMSDLFSYISDSTMRPMQRAVSAMETVPRMVVIEDVPGAGKTEAAVYLAARLQRAFGKSGLYFALPTAATSNQMYERMNQIVSKLNQPGFRLLHGTAWAADQTGTSDIHDPSAENGTETIGSEWLASSRKALLAQNAVGTVDQAMMAALRARYSGLRMLGLAEKVLIIDEVHAYDAYMSDIIELLLMWCGDLEIPVILLSATLPESKKLAFIDAYAEGMRSENSGVQQMDLSKLSMQYPLLTGLYPDGRIEQKFVPGAQDKSVAYELRQGITDVNAIAKLALTEVKNGGNLCVMANTVTDADAIYSAIKDQANGELPILLYHARFTVGARAVIEQKCVGTYGKHGLRPKRSILVCTQVVEQSLDVDFDEMITFIAPIDLLIQRTGRIHRHSENPRPDSMRSAKMIVLIPTAGELANEHHLPGTYYVYAPCVLSATIAYLSEKTVHTLSMLSDTRGAIESVYAGANNAIDQAWAEQIFSDQMREAAASGCEIGEPYPYGYWPLDDISSSQVFGDSDSDIAVATRDGGNSVRVVLADADLYERYIDQRASGRIGADTYREMLLRSVNIPLRADESADESLIETRGRLRGYAICHSSAPNGETYWLSDAITLVRDEPDTGGTGVHIVRIPKCKR